MWFLMGMEIRTAQSCSSEEFDEPCKDAFSTASRWPRFLNGRDEDKEDSPAGAWGAGAAWPSSGTQSPWTGSHTNPFGLGPSGLANVPSSFCAGVDLGRRHPFFNLRLSRSASSPARLLECVFCFAAVAARCAAFDGIVHKAKIGSQISPRGTPPQGLVHVPSSSCTVDPGFGSNDPFFNRRVSRSSRGQERGSRSLGAVADTEGSPSLRGLLTDNERAASAATAALRFPI